MSNLIGQYLGRYHILEQLGEGGMAVVCKAYDTRLERNVAVKVILPQKQHTEKFIKRFEREAKALASLSHPNIVKVIDYGEYESLPYLVMEYLPGGTLKQKLTGKPMNWQNAIQILLPIARALAYAHGHKIIHRDVKPSNILITDSDEPMLSDFGIAKIIEAEESLDLTGTGVGVGTPEYMSPEQAQGKHVDARSDVYSLGMVFYEMVTGRKPYQADTPMAVVWKLASEPLPRPRSFVPGLPDPVDQILLKALAKHPEDRYQNIDKFAMALESLASGASSKDKIIDSRTGSSGVGNRRTVLWSLITITGMALIGILIAWFNNLGAVEAIPTISPVTQLSTLEPTHAPTSLVSGQEGTYLILEDFEDGKIQLFGYSADSNRWQIVDDADGNKVFQVDNRDGTDYSGFSFGADEWQNYTAEYRVRYLAESGSVGLQVRSNGSNYYVVDLGIGEIYLAYPTLTEWVRITTKFPPVQLETWHTVKVIVQGETIQVFIDNARWIDENDSKYKNGGLLMFASPGTYAQVDDFKVLDLGD